MNRLYKLLQYSQKTGRVERDNRSSEAILLISTSSNIYSNSTRKKIDQYENDIIIKYTFENDQNLYRRLILKEYLDGGRGEFCDSPDLDYNVYVPENYSKLLYY